MVQKTSIRFFDKIPVCAGWDEADSAWLYSAVDAIVALIKSKNPRVYWNTCKFRNPELNVRIAR